MSMSIRVIAVVASVAATCLGSQPAVANVCVTCGDHPPPAPPSPSPAPPAPPPAPSTLKLSINAAGYPLQAEFFKRTQRSDDGAQGTGSFIANVGAGGWEPALAFFTSKFGFNGPPAYPGAPQYVHFIRMWGEQLSQFQIYHQKPEFDSFGTIGGHFYHYTWQGGRYVRSAPAVWTAPKPTLNPYSLPMDDAVNHMDPGPIWGYQMVENEGSSSDGWPAPSWMLREFHQFNNSLSGSALQQQFWGRYQISIAGSTEGEVHGDTAGYTHRWGAWSFDGESGWFGGSTKDYSTPYVFVRAWDPEFKKFSVFEGRRYRRNFFSWGTYDGAHVWMKLTRYDINGETGAVLKTVNYVSKIWQMNSDGSLKSNTPS